MKGTTKAMVFTNLEEREGKGKAPQRKKGSTTVEEDRKNTNNPQYAMVLQGT